jgi:hypothetical protein
MYAENGAKALRMLSHMTDLDYVTFEKKLAVFNFF